MHLGYILKWGSRGYQRLYSNYLPQPPEDRLKSYWGQLAFATSGSLALLKWPSPCMKPLGKAGPLINR